MTSILTTVKKLLGIAEEYTQFDTDIIVNINSALVTLAQIGIGPTRGFTITGKEETFEDFLGDSFDPLFNNVQMYLYLKTKIIFDPPTSSYVLESYKEQLKELEFRLNIVVDPIQTFGG